MKWRNQALALACLLAFIGFGFLYFHYWVVQKPFGVILFVCEGIDAETLAAARTATTNNGGGLLELDAMPHLTLVRRNPLENAQGGGTPATDGEPDRPETRFGESRLYRLMKTAQAAGRMTGLVSNSELTGPKAAALYSPEPSRDRAALARQLTGSGINIILGRGVDSYLFMMPESGTESAGDGRYQAVEAAGYAVVETMEALEEVPRWRRAQLFGLFSKQGVASGNGPELSDLVRRAIELLQYDPSGYLLVVLVEKEAERGDGLRNAAPAAVADLDGALKVARQYSGTSTAIFVLAESGAIFPQADRSSAISQAGTDSDALIFGAGEVTSALQGMRDPEFVARLIEENL